MAASLNDLLAQMIGGNMPANPRRQQDIAPLATDTGAAAQSPGQNMLGSVLSNTLYQQLMPLLNTLNARRISNVITNDQYYNTPNNYTYTPGDTNPPPTDGTTGGGTGGTTTTGGTSTFTPVKQPSPTTTTAAKGPYDDLLNSIYQQEFGRAYNPSTDAWWAQQLQSGIENTSNAAGMNKLMQDIAGGARNVAGGTQDLTYEQTGGKTTPTSVDPTALLNSIYQQEFGRAYNPSTDAWWAQQLQSGIENTSNAAGMNKLMQDIAGGARNVAGGTQDLTYEQAHPYAQANTTTQTTGGTTTPTSVDPTALLNQIYQSDFNRAPDASGLSYWQSQLASDPSLLNNPGKLSQMIGGGASSGSSDAAAYAKNMTVNPVTDQGKTITPTLPSNVGPGYVAMLNAANADPQIQAALNGAVDANIPGFTVRRDGGPVHAHRTNPMYYHNGKWYHH